MVASEALMYSDVLASLSVLPCCLYCRCIEIEPIAGDCDLGDDFYGRRGLQEILNFSNVNPSAPTSVSCSNIVKEMTRDCVSHD